jgi:hypothetical protein
MRPLLTTGLGILLILTATPVSAATKNAMMMRAVTVRVAVTVTRFPTGALSIACGTFPTGPAPHLGSRPLTHAVKHMSQRLVTMSLLTPAAARWIGCWPTTSAKVGFNKALTTNMSVATISSPPPPFPITMTSITVVGAGP